MSVAAELAKPGEALSAPKVALKTVKSKPWLAIGVFIVVLLFVILVEAWKPGFFTSPIRKGLQKLGILKAGA
jgi:hypothetical protein